MSESQYLYPAPESWRRLNGAGRWRTGASSVPAWRRSPTGPVTIVLVADGAMWLVRWLRNFIVLLQSGHVEPVECQSLQSADADDLLEGFESITLVINWCILHCLSDVFCLHVISVLNVSKLVVVCGWDSVQDWTCVDPQYDCRWPSWASRL